MTHQNVCASKIHIKCSYLCATCQMHLSKKHEVEVVDERQEDDVDLILEKHKSSYGLCTECSTYSIYIPYPCPTIQAIEKELTPLSKSQVRRITKVKSDELREKELT